ncbi:hypothetical protein [Mycobacterium lacus]|uniref:Uncharacterized protein n=1 Tax=Mycobacterium lacus TaxID=169765 RepID=A0A1X1XV63_9MYCO|nr:hypothetical protein [Mycobacterium lacus]MCV7122298.1 hypothetical protein [Mycobacterium lacus]ORW02651.1 hypothetical protein AWC15_06605 [Mycobacterium lacus]BBX97032.1 hypothetical protein MLAC_23260 [Mycobacterium lacus]
MTDDDLFDEPIPICPSHFDIEIRPDGAGRPAVGLLLDGEMSGKWVVWLPAAEAAVVGAALHHAGRDNMKEDQE